MEKNKIEFIDNWEKFPVNYRFLNYKELEDKSSEDEKVIKLIVPAFKTKSYNQYGFYKHISRLI